VVCGVSEILRSRETQSTTGPSDPGRHVIEIHEFGEKCFGRKQRRRPQYFRSLNLRRGWPEVITHGHIIERV
jgi:hypothetical protein